MAQTNSHTKKITIVYKGKMYSATELAKEYSVVPSTLMRRIRNGWSVEDALKPITQKRART